MTTHNETIADALELIQLSQHALGAAVEEIALWIEARGSLNVHDNITTALEALDTHADGITSAIRILRSE